ncbi:MAG: DUF6017 domain-containing protein [Christensenellaceae bacterium]|nr:DUF6017 domain-containing protein [Christensenellaceae bacterium]
MDKYISLPLAEYQEIKNRLERFLGGMPEEEAMQNISRALSLLEKNHSCIGASMSVRPVRLSLAAAIEIAKRQIDFAHLDYTGNPDLPRYKEICYIIAEVLAMEIEDRDGAPKAIKINGSFTNVEMVQEVYSQLTHAHAELVADNFAQITSKIYNKKAYLQTALYNSVFELDAHYSNQVKHDFGY